MRWRESLRNFADATGLIWLPIALSERFYTPHDTSDEELTKNFEASNSNLGLEELKEITTELEQLQEDEDKRKDKIESKALSLLSLTTVASAFVASMISLVSNVSYPVSVRQTMIIVYGLIVFSLMVTIVLALKVIRVGKYAFMSPSVANIWQLSTMTRHAYYRDKARLLLQSYIHNRALINNKATFASGAQDWFRNTVVLLVLLTFLIVVAVFSSSSINAVPITPTPTVTYTFTPSITHTPSLSPTPLPSTTPTP